MLADDLQALRDGKSVLEVGEMADEVEKLGSTFTANAQRIRSYENAPKLLRAQYAVGWRSSRGRHKCETPPACSEHSLEGLMRSRREADRVVREWTARAGWRASGATEPEEVGAPGRDRCAP